MKGAIAREIFNYLIQIAPFEIYVEPQMGLEGRNRNTPYVEDIVSYTFHITWNNKEVRIDVDWGKISYDGGEYEEESGRIYKIVNSGQMEIIDEKTFKTPKEFRKLIGEYLNWLFH